MNFNRELRDFYKANTVILKYSNILNNIYFNNNWGKIDIIFFEIILELNLEIECTRKRRIF